MRAARRRRTTEAIVLSFVAHGAILAALALHAPRLRIPPPERGPPEAMIPILILPRTPPPTAKPGGQPTPIRLHQRTLSNLLDDIPVKPLVAPATPPAPPNAAPAAKPSVTAPATDIQAAAGVSQALKGLVGCANPGLLSREEREKCQDRLAAGAKSADYLGTGIAADKASGLAAAAQRREQDYRYSRNAPQPTGQPKGIGATAHDLGRILGNDRPEAVKPF